MAAKSVRTAILFLRNALRPAPLRPSCSGGHLLSGWFVVWQPESLAVFYRYMAVTQGTTGLTAKLALGALLYIVHAGELRQARTLLHSAILALFFVSFFLADGDAWTITGVAFLSLAMTCVAGYALWRERNTEWRIVPEDQPWLGITIAAYVIAFAFPFWDFRNVVSRVVFSLMGPLPHQTLLVVLILCAVTGKGSARVLGWAAVACASLLGLLDLIAVQRWSSLLLLVAAGVAAWRMLDLSKPGDGDPAPVRRVEIKEAADSEPAKTDGRKWNLR
jgi:hypothetical protein